MTRLARARHPVLTEWHWKAIRKQVAGDTGGAMQMWAKLLERNPHDAKALYFMALAFYSIREIEKAIAYMQACLHEAPDHSDAWFNLGKFLQDAGRPKEALEHYIAALEHEPTKVEALTNAGNLFMAFGDEDSALGCFHMALAQDSSRPEASYNRSFIKLLYGDLADGFREYEERWRCKAFIVDYERPFMRPIRRATLEDIEEPPTWRVLLHAEQGAGDALMMMRYLRRFRADTLVLEVHKPLVTLFAKLFPDSEVIERGTPIPRDVLAQCPMMSLPVLFGTTLETIPDVHLAYTPAAPRPCECGMLHVGLCWAGSSIHPNDKDRSAPVHAFAQLLAVPGIHWTSLQVGEREEEYPGMTRPLLFSYLESARAVKGLDLVITVDTSIAHLAGVLEVPVWICVPSLPEWRWLLGRGDSPWYPSARLWRRSNGGAWDTILPALEHALRERVAAASLRAAHEARP